MLTRTLHRITGPAEEIVSPAQVKLFLKEDLSLNDTIIDELIVTAREWLEDETGYNFGVSTYNWYVKEFKDVVIPRAPFVVDDFVIKYMDSDGTEQTLNTELYNLIIKERPARLVYKKELPSLDEKDYYPVTISFKAGYGVEEAPKRAITALKLLITHYFNHRDLSDNRIKYDIPIPKRIHHFVAQLKARRFL